MQQRNDSFYDNLDQTVLLTYYYSLSISRIPHYLQYSYFMIPGIGLQMASRATIRHHSEQLLMHAIVQFKSHAILFDPVALLVALTSPSIGSKAQLSWSFAILTLSGGLILTCRGWVKEPSGLRSRRFFGYIFFFFEFGSGCHIDISRL
jgi:hypothetical protein